MTILLLPSLNFIGGRPEVYVPYGLLNLQAVAHQSGFWDVEVAAFSEKYWKSEFSDSNAVVETVLQELISKDFQTIGFSSVCSSVHYSFAIASRLKQVRPKLQVIFGGPFVTKLAADVLRNFDFIDAVFVGEAEHSFATYCKNILSGRRNPLSGIPGVATRSLAGSGNIQVDNLDDLPSTEELAAYSYWANLDLALNKGKNFVPIEATRGCPLKCSFCSTKQVWGPKVRRKSAERLLRDVNHAKVVCDANLFSLIGDNVGVPRNQFLRFCEELKTHEDPFHWACSLKLDRFSDEDLETAWSAGCRGMFIGVETASSDTLRRVNKAADLAREIKNIEAAIQYGFLVETSFIIGFPWETEADLRDTFELHCRFLSLGVKRSQVGILSPIPGTEIVDSEQLDWRIGPGTFSDDGIPLANEHVEFMLKAPHLFSHFASYITPHLDVGALRAYQGAAAQMNGLYQRRRDLAKISTIPFAGREADRTQSFAAS